MEPDDEGGRAEADGTMTSMASEGRGRRSIQGVHCAETGAGSAIAELSAFRIEYEYEYEYDDAEHVH